MDGGRLWKNCMWGQNFQRLHYTAQMLLWNNFRKIYGNYDLFIKYRVVIETKKLSIFNLDPKRSNRLKLIKSLSDQGRSSVEISNYLNSSNLKSPRGHQYTPKLVWMTLDKYKKRLKRFDSYKIVHKSEKLCVISNKFRRPQ